MGPTPALAWSSAIAAPPGVAPSPIRRRTPTLADEHEATVRNKASLATDVLYGHWNPSPRSQRGETRVWKKLFKRTWSISAIGFWALSRASLRMLVWATWSMRCVM